MSTTNFIIKNIKDVVEAKPCAEYFIDPVKWVSHCKTIGTSTPTWWKEQIDSHNII